MNKPMKIITSGYPFVDIDAFACINAYLELLKLKNINSQAIITAELNASITTKFRDLEFYQRKFNKETPAEFIIMDTSAPEHFERFVDPEKVIRIFDHHPGFVEFWQKKLGDNSVIEPIGAAATLIFREIKKQNLLNKLPKLSIELLALAILSNTLNFQAKICTQEDKEAYQELKKLLNTSENFEANYFLEVEETILNDIENSLINDSKQINNSLFIAQIELWNANKFLTQHKSTIQNFLNKNHSSTAFLNLIELEKGQNKIIFNDLNSLKYFQKFFPNFKYNHNTLEATSPHVILRKEILSEIFKQENK